MSTESREAQTANVAARTRSKNELEPLAALYKKMHLIRRLEEEAARAYAQGKIGGFLHLYIGQEAVGVGALATLEKDDYVITTYRDHGIAIAKGMSPNTLMAELFGKKTGCSGGLGGSMHMFDVEHRMLGGYGIVGGHIPVAAGVAFATKYRNEKNVTLCFFGLDRRLPRRPLARCALEAAHRLHLREQRVRDGHADQTDARASGREP